MNQFAEIINSTWGILLTTIMGYIVWLLKEQRKERIIENQKRNANINGTKIILFYMLQKLHTDFRNQGYVTYNQQQAFREIYDAYHVLGGNGYGTRMWEEIKKLEVKNGDIGLSHHSKDNVYKKEKYSYFDLI